MRGEYAVPGLTVRPGELARAAKEWATAETGATVLGVMSGVFLGEWAGTWLATTLNIEDGWTQLIAKGITKAGLSFVLFFIGRRLNPGLGRVFLQGMAAGPLVSIGGDIIGQFVAPALGMGSNTTNIQIKSSNRKQLPANVGNKSKVITSI